MILWCWLFIIVLYFVGREEMEMDYGNMWEFIVYSSNTMKKNRQFTDVLFIPASGKVRHAGVIPLARAVPSGMAPPASCDDSAKAYCKWFFGRKKMGKIGLELGEWCKLFLIFCSICCIFVFKEKLKLGAIWRCHPAVYPAPRFLAISHRFRQPSACHVTVELTGHGNLESWR